ncbi:MAG: cytochrome c3 family protein [Kiloniellaceae bacterium]
MLGSASRTWLLLLLLQLGLAAWSPRATGAAAQPEHPGQRCARCHLAGDDVRRENAHRLTTTQERMCGGCHRGAVEVSHPTGFTPHRPLPDEFPLDWKGQVTCSTCHEVHAGSPRHPEVARTGRALCTSCHPRSFFERMADAGRSIVRSGHLDARARRPARPIDPYSLQCIECHDGRISLPGDRIRAAFSASNGTGMVNHPIGQTYVRADVRRGLRHPAALPPEVLLPDGKVSCVSCHRGYSRRHGALVTRTQTALCLHCHDK